MKALLLFLCLLGCTHLILVVGHPVDQRRGTSILRLKSRIGKTLNGVVVVARLRQDADEQREELAALIGDNKGVQPDIDPHGVEVEEIDSSVNGNSNLTNETTSTSAITNYVTVDIRPTTTLAITGSSLITNRTSSLPATLPTATVNQTSTRGPGRPTTSSVSSASTSVRRATSTPVTASVPSTSSAPSRATTTSTGVPSPTNTPTTRSYILPLEIVGGVIGGIALCLIIFVPILVICVRKRRKRRLRRDTSPDCITCHLRIPDVLDSVQDDSDTDLQSSPYAEGDDYDKCLRSFLDQHPEYQEKRRQRIDLGSRMQKRWYQVEMKDNGYEKKILTIAPVSQHCPLKLHKHQRGLNKLLCVLKEHPFLHSIELVEYLSDHELLVMVQPLMKAGSLKDMIYKTTPLTNWSDKYARRSSGLKPDKIARYGRQILEAMKFLYSKGFPMLGHIQSGNIFIVDDVCHLGGYENTLLGYKTRLFRLCKDELEHFDVILFGHLVFEMSAGYELTHLRPSETEYKTLDKTVRPILEYIFEEGFPHDVDTISAHEFFSDSLSELSEFDSSQVQLSDSMNTVLEKVRKGKIRVQKSTKQKEGTETLAAKFKTTFRGIVAPKFGRGDKDSEGDLEEQLKKTQKKLKKKSSKDIKGVDRTPFLADTDSN